MNESDNNRLQGRACRGEPDHRPSPRRIQQGYEDGSQHLGYDWRHKGENANRERKNNGCMCYREKP